MRRKSTVDGKVIGMADNSIYKDIAKRTGGDIYIGVVGPVRTGKSTFIHKFLESAVIPNIENEYDRARTLDVIPQSASGRTVMTTEPKFIPDESVTVTLGDVKLNVKLIDSVGYLVDGALGHEEDGEARMVMTPWSESAMTFNEAAELGTGKVIGEHSTIGILVTTDGSITDIPRESYVQSEQRVAEELKSLGKPFAIVLNSKNPDSNEARELAVELEKRYGVPVALVNLTELNLDDVREILALVLGQFPVRSLEFLLPEWTEALDGEHSLKKEMINNIRAIAEKTRLLGDLTRELAEENSAVLNSVNAGEGTASFDMPVSREVYYSTLAELTGLDVSSDKKLFSTLTDLSKVKKSYDKVSSALIDVEEKGYGIVMPSPEELTLEEPVLVKQSGGYGVKVSAHAESIHMIKTGIRADVCPVIGSESQSEEVVKYLTEEFDKDPERLWQSNMFGKSLYDLVSDGMNAKLLHMPDESREKLSETLEKIINEGANGLICILL